MPTPDEILSTRDVEEFIATHVDIKEAVERAAQQLHAKPDALAAVRKVLPALAESAIGVFFSYKKSDEETARAVVETLRQYSAGKLRITYQAEFTEEIAGKKWRDKIRDAVRPANWFILLLPDPSDEWDWCLFETGLFVAQRTSADRMICLHHPDTRIPPQIEDYQAVAATVPEVEGLLRMVFVNEDPIPGMPPLNAALERKLPEIAKEIVNAIRPPQKTLVREVFEPWIELKIDRPRKLRGVKDLDSARISSANDAALDLFGFLKKPRTWGELRSEVSEIGGDGRWREELFHVLRRIACDRQFYPVQAVFKLKSGRMFRPVACAVDRLGEEGPIDTFHVTFAEEVGAVDTSKMPDDLSMLADLLRFVFRFRWEVLEEFSRGPLEDADVKRLDNTLRRIKKDWESRHVGDEQQIFSVFTEKQQERFVQMSLAWKEISNEEGTGKLDLALEMGEKDRIPPLLAEFLPMNQEFLEVAAGRFSDLVSGGRSAEPSAAGPPPEATPSAP